jgi:hypothetical protein
MRSDREAATALADLFFLPGPSLSDAEKLRANELRQRYRDWRTRTGAASPQVDVLDLNPRWLRGLVFFFWSLPGTERTKDDENSQFELLL